MLTNTNNVNRYLINGTPLSTYSITFPYWDKDEIKVYLTKSDGTLQTLVETTNYTLSTPNGNNGTLTRVGDWTAGATNLTIVREMSLTQEVDLRNGDKIDAETLETALDDLTAQVQQLAESQSRAVVSPIDEAGSSLTIPNKASRIGSGSGTMMGFGSDGESIALRDLAQFDADVASAASDASSASTSAGTATTQALKSEGYAVGEQNGSPVGNTSPYYQNNSKYYSQVAKAGADVITNNLSAINNLDTNMSDINDVADDITNVVAVAGDLTNIDSVAGDLTNIDAVNSNKTNIDTVAGISSDVTTVAGISADVTTVAGATTDIAAILPDIADVTAVAGDLAKVTAVADDLSNIDDVADDLTNVDTVAADISDVSTVAADITKVTAVADDLTNIDAVNGNKTNIDTVASDSSAINTVATNIFDVYNVSFNMTDVGKVAAIDDDVSDVAGIKSDVTTVAGIASDVTTVAGAASDISDLLDDISDVTAVAADLTKVTAVADDLTNIDAVADDLTNIDAVAADLANINLKENVANKVTAWQSTPDNTHYPSEKLVKDSVNALDARLQNLEEKAGDYKEVQYRGTDAVPAGKCRNALVETIVGKSRPINNILNIENWNTYQVGKSVSGSTVTMVTGNNGNTSDSSIYVAIPMTPNYRGLLSFSVTSATALTNFAFIITDGDSLPVNQSNISFNANETKTFAIDFTTGTNSANQKLYIYFDRSASHANTSIDIKECMVQELNSEFSEYTTAEMATLGVAGLMKIVPDLLKYRGYGTDCKDTQIEGVRTTSANKVDSDSFLDFSSMTKSGDVYSCSWAAGFSSWTNTNKPSKGKFKENTQYTISWKATCGNASNVGWNFKYTDGTASSIMALVNSTSETYATGTSASGKTIDYIYFNYGSGSTFSFRELMVNEGTTAMPYSPYGTLATLSLPSSVTLRSAITKADELDPESGVITRKVYKLTNQSGAIGDTITLTNAKSNVTDIICSDGLIADIGTISGTTITLTKAISGASFVYERATEDTSESIAPMPNVMIQTEGGGTIRTMQTQGYEIDNCLDVGYMTA